MITAVKCKASCQCSAGLVLKRPFNHHLQRQDPNPQGRSLLEYPGVYRHVQYLLLSYKTNSAFSEYHKQIV